MMLSRLIHLIVAVTSLIIDDNKWSVEKLSSLKMILDFGFVVVGRCLLSRQLMHLQVKDATLDNDDDDEDNDNKIANQPNQSFA